MTLWKKVRYVLVALVVVFSSFMIVHGILKQAEEVRKTQVVKKKPIVTFKGLYDILCPDKEIEAFKYVRHFYQKQ